MSSRGAWGEVGKGSAGGSGGAGRWPPVPKGLGTSATDLVELGVRAASEEAVELDEHPEVHVLRDRVLAGAVVDTATSLDVNALQEERVGKSGWAVAMGWCTRHDATTRVTCPDVWLKGSIGVGWRSHG